MKCRLTSKTPFICKFEIVSPQLCWHCVITMQDTYTGKFCWYYFILSYSVWIVGRSIHSKVLQAFNNLIGRVQVRNNNNNNGDDKGCVSPDRPRYRLVVHDTAWQYTICEPYFLWLFIRLVTHHLAYICYILHVLYFICVIFHSLFNCFIYTLIFLPRFPRNF